MTPLRGASRVYEVIMATMSWRDIARSLRLGGLALAIAAAAPSLWQPAFAGSTQQRAFASPEQAASALVAATRAGRTAELQRILGPAGRKLVVSGDPVADKNGRARFVSAYDTMNSIDRQGDDKAVLIIGEEHWPFAIPIIRQGKAWRFDTKAGAAEILARRIGRNELNAIEVCRAYVDAQREYASKDRNGDGLLEYAQKFVSSPGQQDGLYWPAKPGEEASPIGPLVALARAEGYGGKRRRGGGSPYHGYYYQILKRQGPGAAGGAHDYIAKGRMIGGFALVAFPASYRASGIMTFMINQDGVVYEKNLGPNSAALARRMTIFNPDATWKTP
jgi:hypothetical protein